jgi:hypothetical protein
VWRIRVRWGAFKYKEKTWERSMYRGRHFNNGIRAAPPVLNTWLQTVKFIVKKSKYAGLAQEIGSSPSNSWSLPQLVKGTTQLCTSKKECNKLDLTAAHYFWSVDHNDWSRWFAISSSHVYGVPRIWSSRYNFIGGVAKTK